MHVDTFLRETAEIAAKIDCGEIERMVAALSFLRGKMYIVGFGGSLANAIHMAADLRKICRIDAEAFDNIAEWTARVNDDGVTTVFSDWLSRMTSDDILFVLSVGGGTMSVSRAICEAVDIAHGKGCAVYGIVGPDGGYAYEKSEIVIRIPVANKKHVTPHTEAFQAVIWHLLVSHPLLQRNACKW